MTTLIAQDKEDQNKIYEVWELHRGARVPVHYRREEKGKEVKEGNCIAVFDYMDGMYGRWHDEETNEALIFNGKFKHREGKNYEFYVENKNK